MKWVMVWISVLALCGCATRLDPAPPEALGNNFIISQISLAESGAKVTFAFHPTNQNGKLKICGLYLIPRDQKVYRIVSRGISDDHSTITFSAVGDLKDTENTGISASIRPYFLPGYLVSPTSPLATSLNSPGDRNRLLQDLNTEKLSKKLAECVTSEVDWNEALFNNVKISLYNTKYTYILLAKH